MGTTSKSSNCYIGDRWGTRRLNDLAWVTTKESRGVNRMSVPWGDAKQVGWVHKAEGARRPETDRRAPPRHIYRLTTGEAGRTNPASVIYANEPRPSSTPMPSRANSTAAMRRTILKGIFGAATFPKSTAGTSAIIMPSVVPVTTIPRA
jgi:hypothetical protein